jgi:hypothetical protein
MDSRLLLTLVAADNAEKLKQFIMEICMKLFGPRCTTVVLLGQDYALINLKNWHVGPTHPANQTVFRVINAERPWETVSGATLTLDFPLESFETWKRETVEKLMLLISLDMVPREVILMLGMYMFGN